MEREKALEIWKQLFQDREIAYDFASHPMKREEFNNAESPYGWNIDLKKPFLNVSTNMICCALTTIRIRAGKPTFKIGQNTFEVRRGKTYGTFSIYDITDRNHPINMDPNEENQNPEFNKNRLHSIATVDYQSKNTFQMVSPDQIRKKVFQDNLNQDYIQKTKEEKQPSYIEEKLEPSHVVLNRNEAIQETYIVKEPEENSVQEQENVVQENHVEPTEKAPVEETVVVEEQQENPTEETVILEEAHEEPVEEVEQQEEISTEEVGQQQENPSEEEVIEEPEEVKEEDKTVFDQDVSKRFEILQENGIPQPEIHHTEIKVVNQEEEENPDDTLSVEERKTKEKIFELETLIEKLKTQIKADMENLSEINQALNVSRTENEQLAKELEEAKQNPVSQPVEDRSQEQMQSMLLANEALKKQIVELQEKNQQLQERNETLTSERDVAISECEVVKESNITLSQQINEMEQTPIHDEQSENEIAQLKEEKSQLEQRIAVLEEEKQRNLEENISTSQQNYQVFESLKRENAQLRQQNEELEGEKNNILQEKDDIISNLSNEKNELQQRVDAFELQKQQESQQQEAYTLQNEEELNQLRRENENLNQELTNLNELHAKLKEEKEKIQKEYDSLEAQSQFTDDQKEIMDTEYQQLFAQENKMREEFQDLQIKYYNLTLLHEGEIRERDHEIEELHQEIENRENQLNESKEKISNLSSNKQIAEEEKNQIEQLNKANIEKISELYKIINQKDIDISLLNQKNSDQEKNDKEEKVNLLVEKDYYRWYSYYLENNGNPETYKDFISYMNEKGLELEEDSIKEVMANHRNWQRKESTKVDFDPYYTDPDVIATEPAFLLIGDEDISHINKERDRRNKALSYYAEIFGEDKEEVSDFAGRYLRLENFGDKDSPFGWDYVLFNEKDIENIDNILIANYRSLKDFKPNEKFESNGHAFQVEKEGEKYLVVSKDFITDPYNFDLALQVTKDNIEKNSPLLYLYIKVTGVKTTKAEPRNLMEFFDLVDRTVKRCCPKSFIEMKTNAGTTDSIFLTFDGSLDGAYKEVLDYATLVNSYRRIFREKDKVNAIIILNQVNVPFSKRHLDYENLLKESKDVELKAIRYELNLAVINSTIKRSIHIGPTILDNLPINQEYLKPSMIGKGDFSKVFQFNGEFKVCNLIFDLKRKPNENSDND